MVIAEPQKIYLAAAYERHAEMRGVRDALEALGHRITSRWIDLHAGSVPEAFTMEELNADPGAYAQYAEADSEDLDAAGTVICFTGTPGIGHHVEFGIAVGRGGKRLVIVGPRERVFHALPDIEWHPDLAHLVMAWSPAFAGSSP
jgi:hypothetical protein